MSATVELWQKRLDALLQTPNKPARRVSADDARTLVQDTMETIRLCLQRGDSASAIAKALAPKGERPSWTTIRRSIAEEFGIAKQVRRPRGKRKVNATGKQTPTGPNSQVGVCMTEAQRKAEYDGMVARDEQAKAKRDRVEAERNTPPLNDLDDDTEPRA